MRGVVGPGGKLAGAGGLGNCRGTLGVPGGVAENIYNKNFNKILKKILHTPFPKNENYFIQDANQNGSATKHNFPE